MQMKYFLGKSVFGISFIKRNSIFALRHTNISVVCNQSFIIKQVAFLWNFYKNINNRFCPNGITEVYLQALPYLEKAYELNPKDFSTVETLKILTFRLRDEEGIGPKSEKYTKIYNEMKAAQ